ATAPDAGAARASALVEYQRLRTRMPDTAFAHHELGLWCRQNRLESEAVVQFRLKVDAQKKEARAQKKWVHDWEPRLRKWKSWLATKGLKDEAETALV